MTRAYLRWCERDTLRKTQHFCGLSPVSVLAARTLKKLAQDKTFAHGMNIYIKSVLESTPTYSVVNSLLQKTLELNAAPGNEIDHGYMWELFPPHTVLSRSEDSTAHVRTNRHTTGCILKWMNNPPGVQQAAKRAAHELTDIVAKAEAQASGMKLEYNTGYGNYSECHLAFLLHRTTQIFLQIPTPRNTWPLLRSTIRTRVHSSVAITLVCSA